MPSFKNSRGLLNFRKLPGRLCSSFAAILTRGAPFLLIPGMVWLAACSSGTPSLREAMYMSRGKRYLAAKDYRKASIAFRVASQNMPKDAEPFYQLALTYLGGARPNWRWRRFRRPSR